MIPPTTCVIHCTWARSLAGRREDGVKYLSLKERRAFSGKKPRDHAHSRSPQMRKGRNRANSDLLFVSADDLEKNPEHENEPRWQPNPAKIIKVTPQKADFRLRKCQGVKCDQTGDSAAGTDTGNGGSRGQCNVQEIPNGWRGELREPSAVAAAASTAEEHATRVPPQKCLKWQLHIRVSSTALQVYHARRAAELASLLRLRFGLAVPA